MSSRNTNTPRLLAAAKEFNIGKETLVEFLKGNGFEIDASKPNTKLSEEMYDALQGEFAQDKLAKRKSDAIALPKGSLLDNINKTPSDLDVSFKDKKAEPPAETLIPPVKEEKPVEETIAEREEDIIEEEHVEEQTPVEEKKEAEIPEIEQIQPDEQEIEEIEEKKEPEQQEVNDVPDAPEEEVTVEKEEVKPEEQPAAEEEMPEETLENVQEEVPEKAISSVKLTGPKVLDKIDLDVLNQSTRPKKAVTKKKETTVPPAKKEEVPPKKEESPEKKEPTKPIEKKKPEAPKEIRKEEKKEDKKATPHKLITEVNFDVPEEELREHIEMKAPKLDGPKVIGKIELPVGTVGGRQERKEKRKRKRIPVEKKPESKSGSSAPKPAQDNKPKENNNQRNNQRDNKDNRDRRDNNRRNKPAVAAPQQEIDAKEIQEKIRETQARLSGGGSRSRNLKAKYRRNKREEMAEKRAAAEMADDGSIIQVTEFISVSEFANLLNVSFADIISKCMSLGIMVSINQRLDAEVIELVASEFDKEVEFINLDQNEEEEEEELDAEDDLEPRAPVITIMGHVDHGKTSLLDYIRNASVVAGEAGGITQHIGAYRVTTESGKDLTFLDTPGHEAFTAMRARGAKAADIAIIVVAADDAIMPQTREAISHAQAAGLPMVFAINKIDKESANPDKIKEQLSAMNILVEDWGGKYQSQEISAKKGLNIDQLLEKILLEAELLELKANPDKGANGLVIEASLDKGRGFVSTILVQGGTLKSGDMIVSGQHYGKVKAMFNERGLKVLEAGPSTPVQVLGLNGAPQAGEKFKVYVEESDAKNVANHRAQILREQGLRSRKHITLDEIGRRLALGNFKELNVIIRADVDGSSEALSDSLQKLSTEEVVVNVVHKGVGQISESDVMLASASDAIILGFQVRPSSQAAKIAENENIEIRYYSVIYDAIAEIKSAMEGMLEPAIEKKIVGNIEIREIFKISGVGSIAGCYVLDGKFTRNTRINIIRDGIVVHTGELSSLKRFKDDVKEVSAGYECGLTIKNYNDIYVGDIIEGYEEVEVKRKL